MTWIECEGFEVYGDDGTSGADMQTGLDLRYDDGTSNAGTSGSLAASFTLADNDEADGTWALEFPATSVGQAANLAIPTKAAYNVVPNSTGELVYSFRWFYDENFTGTKRMFSVMTGNLGSGTAFASGTDLSIVDDGAVEWDDGGAAVKSATGVLVDQTWHYIQIRMLFSATGTNAGTVTVTVDGTDVIDISSRGFFASFNKFWGVRFEQDQSMPIQRMDDLVIYELDGVDHTEIIGDRRIVRLVPESDASPNDFTPSTGTDNYALIDEVELDETDYVDGTNAEDDHYGITEPSASVIDCLQIDVVCQATSGTPTLHIGFDDGTADEVSGGVIGTAANEVVRAIFPLDPSNDAWTASAVGAVDATQRVTE